MIYNHERKTFFMNALWLMIGKAGGREVPGFLS